MEHFLPPRKPTSFSVMTDGDTVLIIFSSEIFFELKPRIFECKIVQFPSLFIKLGLFVQSFLNLFCLVLFLVFHVLELIRVDTWDLEDHLLGLLLKPLVSTWGCGGEGGLEGWYLTGCLRYEGWN